jgi:cytochrome c-type biogenesis protein CcmF
MVANHSTLRWDLYLVYEGQDASTGLPIIKAFLNPLVSWIWIGLAVVVAGTLIAQVPNSSPGRAAVAVPLKSAGITGQLGTGQAVPGPGSAGRAAAIGLTGGGD